MDRCRKMLSENCEEFGKEILKALKPKKKTKEGKLKLAVLFENFPDVDLTQKEYKPADKMLKEALLRRNKGETIAVVSKYE